MDQEVGSEQGSDRMITFRIIVLVEGSSFMGAALAMLIVDN